jgi:nitrite reductase (NO-forming)
MRYEALSGWSPYSRLLTCAAVSLLAASALAAPPHVGNVAKDPTEVPASPAGDVTVDLEVVEALAEVAPGKTAWVWTFALKGEKATVPGPMIRVRQGRTVTVNLCNTLPDNVEPHNVDFHAAMGPGGGAAATNVEPGECRRLRFKATRAGAYIYHCAGEGMPWEHVAYGMYGLIQVDPPFGPVPGFREFYVGQSDWYLKVDEELNAAEGFPPGTFTLDEARAEAEHPTEFTFNGHTKALADPALYGGAIHVRQGDRVRFFFVTGGPNLGSNWHVIGTVFDAVYTGSLLAPMLNEETVYVAPGSAAIFELSAPVPGQFLLVDHALFRVPKGAAGLMHVACRVPRRANGTCPTWPHDLYSPEVTGTGH